jgi:uncharacterized protein YutD
MDNKIVHKKLQEIKDNLELLPLPFSYLKAIKALSQDISAEAKETLKANDVSISSKISQIDVFQSNYCCVGNYYKTISRVMQKKVNKSSK